MSLITRGFGSTFGMVTWGMGYTEVTVVVPPAMEGLFLGPGLWARPRAGQRFLVVKTPIKGTLLVRFTLVERVIGTLGVRMVMKIRLYGVLSHAFQRAIHVTGTLSTIRRDLTKGIQIIGKKSLRSIKVLLLTLLEEEDE